MKLTFIIIRGKRNKCAVGALESRDAMEISASRTQVPVAGERWRELTLQANAQHAARNYQGALRLYNAAFDEAEAVLGRELRQADTQRIIGPLLLTISDHNLAQVARVQGKHTLASRHLVVAFERLIGLGLAPEVPLCIRASAARSLRPALEQLFTDLGIDRQEPRASALICRARAVQRVVDDAEKTSRH